MRRSIASAGGSGEDDAGLPVHRASPGSQPGSRATSALVRSGLVVRSPRPPMHLILQTPEHHDDDTQRYCRMDQAAGPRPRAPMMKIPHREHVAPASSRVVRAHLTDDLIRRRPGRAGTGSVCHGDPGPTPATTVRPRPRRDGAARCSPPTRINAARDQCCPAAISASIPVLACLSPTGLDSGDPRCRR